MPRIKKFAATVGINTGGTVYIAFGTAAPSVRLQYTGGVWSYMAPGRTLTTLASPGTAGACSIELTEDVADEHTYHNGHVTCVFTCPDGSVTYETNAAVTDTVAVILLANAYCTDATVTTEYGDVEFTWDSSDELDEWYCEGTYPTLSGGQIAFASTTVIRYQVPYNESHRIIETTDGMLFALVAKHSRLQLNDARPYVWGVSAYPDVLLYRNKRDGAGWELVGTAIPSASFGTAVMQQTSASSMVSIRHFEEAPDGSLLCAISQRDFDAIHVVGSDIYTTEQATWWFRSTDGGVTWVEVSCAATDGGWVWSIARDPDGSLHVLMQPGSNEDWQYKHLARDLSPYRMGNGEISITLDGWGDRPRWDQYDSENRLFVIPNGDCVMHCSTGWLWFDVATGTFDYLRYIGFWYTNVLGVCTTTDASWHCAVYDDYGYVYYITLPTIASADYLDLAQAIGTIRATAYGNVWLSAAVMLVCSDHTLQFTQHSIHDNAIGRYTSTDGGRTWALADTLSY